MKDATRNALCEMRLLAAYKLHIASQNYMDIDDLERHGTDNDCDIDYPLKNLHMAANLITMFENFEKKLVENDEYNRLYIMTMLLERGTILRERYSSDMSIDETHAWKELIDSFKDSHHAGDEKL